MQRPTEFTEHFDLDSDTEAQIAFINHLDLEAQVWCLDRVWTVKELYKVIEIQSHIMAYRMHKWSGRKWKSCGRVQVPDPDEAISYSFSIGDEQIYEVWMIKK